MLEDMDMVMHLHLNELGAICLDLWMVMEQIEVQNEMILGMEESLKDQERETDGLCDGL